MYTPTEAQQALHRELDELTASGAAKQGNAMIAHALIALGFVSRVECVLDDCMFDTRQFAPIDGMRLSIDHRVWVAHGGSDYPDNLDLSHWACNHARQPARKKRLSEGRRRGSGGASGSKWAANNMTVSCKWGCGYQNRPASVGAHQKTCVEPERARRDLTPDEVKFLRSANDTAEQYLRAQDVYLAGVSLLSLEKEMGVSYLRLHRKVKVPARKKSLT